MMGIMFDVGRLADPYALPAEEKVKCAESLRRLAKFIEKAVGG